MANKCNNDNPTIINHRFGSLTVIEQIGDSAQFRCRCDCGNEITLTRSYIVSYNKLSCGQCGTTRDQIIAKYGTISDYIIPGVVCSHCGSPFVYNHSRGLCRNCNARFQKRGTTEYYSPYRNLSQEEKDQIKKDKQKQRQKQKVLRRNKTIDALCYNPDNEAAQVMADLYINKGFSYTQIANIFGVSRQLVHQILHSQKD